ncbi:hypothetical protein TSTA_062050 [Talaromyces stipitatus ATCC 10500]|uniref:Uncharacterized protein n=1 Tax=Talaromyces stipitatus (strain ATCC 10500 / CBS 375.48 / QM 6759 / NRRL 1006) TaxID=441959 RepID=B8LX67_TALSN|nr:uncharacterized protein TSTA_062050 [Talaromyces stipitatus ATCC 10500]EED22717.1 hypothetical protein TSTA_062050 [Talaromyces stipitatus ATCC 10500]
MDNSDITHVSTSPARGNENHAVNERSSVSPANTSQAVALQNAAASTRNVTHEDSMLAASPLESKNSSVYVDRADKDGAKRKRDVDELADTSTSKRVVDETGILDDTDSSDESISFNDPGLRSPKYYRRLEEKFDAELARRAALSPEARKKEDFKNSRRYLKDHITPRLLVDRHGLPVDLDYYPRFILQLAPDSRNGATCRLDHCTHRIKPGDYRIALTPGMSDPRGPDYYHVRCFEHLLHMSSPHYAARFDADMEKHTPDRGARSILEEYISRWRLRLAPAQNQENPSSSIGKNKVGESEKYSPEAEAEAAEQQEEPVTIDDIRELADIIAGRAPPIQTESARVRARCIFSAAKAAVKDKWKIADEFYEQVRKAKTERIRQRAGIYYRPSINEDNSRNENEGCSWNITQYLLSETDPKYTKRHALSQALKGWKRDVKLATAETNKLNDAGRQAQANLPIEKIKRYV